MQRQHTTVQRAESHRQPKALFFEYDGEYIYPDLDEFPSIVKDAVCFMVDNMSGPHDQLSMQLRCHHFHTSDEVAQPKVYDICVVWPPYSHIDDALMDSDLSDEERRHS